MPPLANAVNKTNNLDSTRRNAAPTSGNNNNNSNNGLYGNKGSLPSSSSGNNNGNGNNNNIKLRDIDDSSSCVDSNSLKHPVGLEAIKEMTRNKNIDNQT